MTPLIVRRGTTERRIILLQLVTLGWMLMECIVSLTAAWQSSSVSLLAFGSDSIVELISAVVVLLQFTPQFQISQVRAARFCGVLPYCLVGIVCLIAVAGLFNRLETDTSRLGIAITGGALLLMPILARMKRDAAEESRNQALRADALQSATCAYLAALTLGGPLLRWVVGLHWLDQAAPLPPYRS